MINMDNFTLLDILPENLIGSDEDQALALAITKAIKKVIADARILDPLEDPPEDMLDLIAWENHVDFYKSTLPVEQKRSVIANAFLVHSQKGTPFAVEQVCETFLKDATVKEWFEYSGEPFFFKLHTTEFTLNDEKIEELLNAIETAKNKRSRLDKIVIEMSEEANIYYGVALHTGETIVIK